MIGAVIAYLGGDCVNPPIGQATANCANDSNVCALAVRHLAGVVTKIELAAIATKVGFAHMVIGADHAALEN